MYKIHHVSNQTASKSESMDDFSVSYVKGQRGARKIVCNGYSYICAKVKSNRKYWVCAKQRSRNCKARLITDSDETFLMRRNQDHNHEPMPTSALKFE